VAEVHDAVTYARGLGFTDISVPIEDASRGEDDLLRAIVETALDAGARTFVIGDTSGCLTPAEYGDVIARFRTWAPDPAVISTHCHDDFGLSTANSLAGVEAGAGEVQATLGGIGERAGNTALEEVAAVLLYKGEKLGYYTDIRTEDLYEVYGLLRETIRLAEPRNKSIFGEFAFGTAAGVHQQGYLRNPATYEYVEPARFGRRREIMVGRHSGRVVLRYVLEQLDYQADDDELDHLYATYIAGRTDADVERLDGLQAHLADVLGAGAATRAR
jgi:2-isopropylmalate synthase